MHTLKGPYGTADRLDLPTDQDSSQTVCMWLVTAEVYHPAWSQYRVATVKLDDDAKGFPPPVHYFAGSTHEMNVCVLNPYLGPYQAVGFFDRKHAILTPPNVVAQVIATDPEMDLVTQLMVSGIVNGLITPETRTGPDMVRQQWSGMISRTLQHVRTAGHVN